MNFVRSVPKTTKDVYESSKEAIELLCADRTIKADIFDMDIGAVVKLKIFCLRKISQFFIQISPLPTMREEDLIHLYEILPTGLDLKYTISIEDEIFWERSYKDNWPDKTILIENDPNFWKKIYLSMFLQTRIEQADPTEMEFISDLTSMVSPYVNNLKLTTLQVVKVAPSKRVVFEDNLQGEKHSSGEFSKINLKGDVIEDHISLEILSNLICLIELDLNFALNNESENREAILFRLSKIDCELICRGLSKLENFRILRLKCCFINVDMMRVFMKYTMENHKMEELCICYCNLSDESLMLLSYVLLHHKSLKTVRLRENNFGDGGIQALAYAMAEESSKALQTIDLSMNMLSDVAASFLASAIVRCRENPKELILSGCGIKDASAATIAGSLKYNRSLKFFDIGANDFSGDAAKILLESVRNNPKIQVIDTRYSGIPGEIADEIKLLLKANKNEPPVDGVTIPPLYLNNPDYLVWDYDPNNPDYEPGHYPQRVAEK